MKTNGISFNEEIKSEICNLVYDETSAYFLLVSLFINSMEIKIKNNQSSYVVTSQYPQVIRLIKKLIEMITKKFDFNITITDLTIPSTHKNIEIEIVDHNNQFEKSFNWINFDQSTINNELKKRSFILGAYLSHGSISFSNKKSSYHFEIKSFNENYLKLIQKLLHDFNITAKIIKSKQKYTIYFKKAEYISDILKLFNAVQALYKFEDFRIQKDFSNSLQRLNNLEVSNLNKTIKASEKQLIWIKKIRHDDIFETLSKKEQLFCNIRMNNPEASLSEIAQIMKTKYNIGINRTSLNHYVRKIQQVYQKLENEK